MSKAIDLTQAWEKHKGQWVTFDKQYKVITADTDAKKAYEAAKKKGYTRPLLFYMPQEDLPFFGGFSVA